jgi:hypothetical protein
MERPNQQEEEVLTEYELQREAIMARNKAKLAELEVSCCRAQPSRQTDLAKELINPELCCMSVIQRSGHCIARLQDACASDTQCNSDVAVRSCLPQLPQLVDKMSAAAMQETQAAKARKQARLAPAPGSARRQSSRSTVAATKAKLKQAMVDSSGKHPVGRSAIEVQLFRHQPHQHSDMASPVASCICGALSAASTRHCR